LALAGFWYVGAMWCLRFGSGSGKTLLRIVGLNFRFSLYNEFFVGAKSKIIAIRRDHCPTQDADNWVFPFSRRFELDSAWSDRPFPMLLLDSRVDAHHPKRKRK
jgi:hypothetical protein